MDLAVLLENRFPPVRVRGRGDFIFYFIVFGLEVQGVSKQIKYRLADSGRGRGTRTLFSLATSLTSFKSEPVQIRILP